MRMPSAIRSFKLTPTMKLTLSYLAIIMAISLTFSVVQYRISSNEVGNGLRRQGAIYQLPGESFNGQDLYSARQREVEASHRRLVASLTVANLAILLAAGLASYVLARRTLQPIEDALETQGRFAADASHELRTPLTAMKSEVEVALRDPKLNAGEARELLKSNLEEIAKLEALTNGLLKLARQDGGVPDEAVRLDDVARAAVDRLHHELAERKIDLSLTLAELTVSGDRASLLELVVTLLDNAVKYSERGTAIAIRGEEHGKIATLAIEDHGVGIKAVDLPHIFDRFYRADTSRSKLAADGYGLGLSIAKQIADMHHGSITVRSTPGRGSTFIIQLPSRRV